MRAVVTGGAGHIGSHLTEQLVEIGMAVRVVDDLSSGRRTHLTAVAGDVEFVVGDICAPVIAEEACADADLVFHLAGAVGVRAILADPLAAVATNLDGTRAIVAACRRSGARLVFASTSEVYGRPERLPMAEDDPLAIGAPTSPRWSYALTKALDEHLVLEAGRSGIDATVLRYFNSYGPRAAHEGDASVVTRFIRQALAGEPMTVHGAGDQVRCFTHVSDVARATLLAGIERRAVGAVLNVGTAVPTTVRELATAVAAVVGTAEIVHVDPKETYGAHFDETPARVPATDRVCDLLGWTPTVTLHEGIAATVGWYRDLAEASRGRGVDLTGTSIPARLAS